jgi:parvulin-like peptidyl-prolyl isomerase
MAAAIRQSNRQSLDDLAKKFNLELGQTPPASITEPVGALGSSQDLHQVVFQLRSGELSAPLQLPQGFVIISLQDVLPAHQGTLAEVHDKVLSDYQQDKSLELARAKADDFTKRVQSGEDFDKAAKALDLTVKTPEPFSRTGTVPDLGTAQQLSASFGMPVGQLSAPTQIAGNWLIYKVVGHEAVIPEDLAKQSDQIRQELLAGKQQAAFDAFRIALEDRLKAEGKLAINADAIKRVTRSS